MKIATGKIVEGKVVLEGVAFAEGTTVTVLARELDDGVLLAPEEDAELLLAIAEADRDEMVSMEAVLAKLAGRNGHDLRASGPPLPSEDRTGVTPGSVAGKC